MFDEHYTNLIELSKMSARARLLPRLPTSLASELGLARGLMEHGRPATALMVRLHVI